ncbi:MAG: DUF1957 domain-containing protein, partial [Planctomycetes bacterium]|nr:DUF1957 domain-containing protein [Planctomycetota bacterium]
MSITPPLCEMLSDELLQERYVARLVLLRELCEKEVERTREMPEFHNTALMYRVKLAEAEHLYEKVYQRDLLGAFRRLQDKGYLELITCAATHGFLPLFSHPSCVRAQLRMAVKNFEKHFHRPPQGVWLPECGYVEGLEDELASVNLRYFFLDSHGIFYSTPRPRSGVFAPLACRNGVAVFGRDIESSRQVWSSEGGYPGDPTYREFYRDIGYDADEEAIKPYLHEDGVRRNLGIKYHRITGRGVPLQDKALYNSDEARNRAIEHAGNFMYNRQAQIRYLASHLDHPPIIVAPYDAELFGHWWYEGPVFLDSLFRKIAYDQDEIELTTPTEELSRHPRLQVVQPSPSSWGDKGYYETWLNGSNDWIYRHLHKAEGQMVEIARAHRGVKENQGADSLRVRALNQAARELMLAQSSDWAFIMTTGTMVKYAEQRVFNHINRFGEIYEMLASGKVIQERLEDLENRDNIFPEMDFTVYCD